LASDQRYCLECGERCASIGGALLAGVRQGGGGGSRPSGAGPDFSRTVETSFVPKDAPVAMGATQRGNTVTVIAGVGVLLLAMGVGVLIGRAGGAKPTPAPAQVISVAQPGATTGGAPIPTTPATTTTPGGTAKGASPSKAEGAKKGAAGGGGAKGGSGAAKAPAATPKSSSPSSGKSFEEKSKSLPNVVETG
jgi:hypothetical protein